MLSYEEWERLSRMGRKGSKDLSDFERKNPATAMEYEKRRKDERKKRSEILSIEDTRARHKAIFENMALFRQ